MKILFAAPYCLLDPSSGAALSCRTILERLAARGHTAQAFSATIFDAPLFRGSDEFLKCIGARKLERIGKNLPPPGIIRATGWSISSTGRRPSTGCG